MLKNKLIVTTPLFYVNSHPHVGHLYSLIYADALVRWKRFNSQDCIFLTGTDEHGQKVHSSAILHNKDTLQYCNMISDQFKSLCHTYKVSYDIFTRTTDCKLIFSSFLCLVSHTKKIQEIWTQLYQKNQIYKGIYKGYYSQVDEAFVGDKDLNQSRQETKSGHKVEWIEEDNYYFRLIEYKDYLRDFIEKKYFQQKIELRQEVQNLKDLCISRPNHRVKWGIPVPNDVSQNIYVWLDALFGYMQDWKQEEYNFHHVIGKDIVRFHTIFWPSFLKSLGKNASLNYTVHHHWIRDNKKMSKSLKNVICPVKLLTKYNQSAIRLYCITEGPQNFDVSFLESKLEKQWNDYVHSYINAIYRILNPKIITQKEFVINLSKLPNEEQLLIQQFKSKLNETYKLYDEGNFQMGYSEVKIIYFMINRYIDSQTPWKIGCIQFKQIYLENVQRRNEVIGLIIIFLKCALPLLDIFVPDKTEKIKAYISPSEPLQFGFPNLEKDIIIKINNEKLKNLLEQLY